MNNVVLNENNFMRSRVTLLFCITFTLLSNELVRSQSIVDYSKCISNLIQNDQEFVINASVRVGNENKKTALTYFSLPDSLRNLMESNWTYFENVLNYKQELTLTKFPVKIGSCRIDSVYNENLNAILNGTLDYDKIVFGYRILPCEVKLIEYLIKNNFLIVQNDYSGYFFVAPCE